MSTSSARAVAQTPRLCGLRFFVRTAHNPQTTQAVVCPTELRKQSRNVYENKPTGQNVDPLGEGRSADSPPLGLAALRQDRAQPADHNSGGLRYKIKGTNQERTNKPGMYMKPDEHVSGFQFLISSFYFLLLPAYLFPSEAS